jgi:hypothetical protein
VYGNHDAMSSRAQFQTGPFFVSFTMPREGECGGRPSGTEAYYSFDVGDVHVVVIDSSESSMRANGPMVGWLTLDLAANLRPWTIVLAHHPPYTFGSHNSDDPEDSGGNLFEIRENVVPVLDDAGVDLMLTGHSHGYERSRPIDGHYGTSDTYAPSMNKVGGDGDPDGDGAYLKAAGPNGGVVHVVSGSSSKAVPQMALHPTMVRAMPVLGSVVVEVGGDVLDGWFVRPDGTIDDHFQLRREPDGGGGGGDDLFADGFETGWGGWTYHN